MTKSREHNDHYRKREARETEALRAEVGSEAIDKLDRIIVRDILHARRQRAFDELFEVEPEKPRFEVMVNLKSGRRADPQPFARLKIRATDKKHISPAAIQQRVLKQLAMRRGRLATDRLVSGLTDRDCTVKRKLWLTHSVVVETSSNDLTMLALREDVATLNNNKRRFVASLDVSRPLIRADVVENVNGVTGRGVRVAICDTGVDFTHPALAAVMGTQTDHTGEGIGDLHGHGTHCAGVVASQDRERRGVAPGCTINEIKIMDMFGGSTPDIAILGIQTATQNSDVSSNSWGWTHADGAWVCAAGDCVLCVAADNAVNAGLVFVVSAGNEDNDTCATYDTHIGCPGNARNVITVGASDDGDNMADFSSIGPTPDGRSKPDIVAPGVDIGSCRASTGSDMNGSATPIDANWINASGTSMSCPHVAGLAALMLEQNGAATPQQIKDALMATAIDIGATIDEQGAGRVDAVDAVAAI